MKLINTLSSLLVESASYQSIYDAVRNRQVLAIYYDGDEPGGKGERLIEPVCLGESLAGNKVLRAWDYEGASHRAYIGEKPLPSWRFFRLDKILSSKETGYTFSTPREGYNPKGDRKMRVVYVNADFSKQPEAPLGQEAPKEPSKNWIQRVKDKFTGWLSRFKK